MTDEGYLKARDGLRLYWKAVAADVPRAVLVAVHGYGDHGGRYLHALEYFARHGYQGYAFDYRGHGRSDGRRGYVRRWDEYLDDLDVFLAWVEERRQGLPLFVLGQSHGGLLLGAWATRREGQAEGVVLTSPYLQLAMPVPAAKIAAGRVANRIVPWLPMKSELHANLLTRNAAEQGVARVDTYTHGIATPRWYFSALDAQVRLLADAERFRLPCLLIHGMEDRITLAGATAALYERIGSPAKELRLYAGMRHETLRESGSAHVLSDIHRWLERRLSAGR